MRTCMFTYFWMDNILLLGKISAENTHWFKCMLCDQLVQLMLMGELGEGISPVFM